MLDSGVLVAFHRLRDLLHYVIKRILSSVVNVSSFPCLTAIRRFLLAARAGRGRFSGFSYLRLVVFLDDKLGELNCHSGLRKKQRRKNIEFYNKNSSTTDN